MKSKILKHNHKLNEEGNNLRDTILGGQDGLVNVLGSVLGVAAATNSTAIVIIAGVASTLAESISMGAVAYTSSKASHEFYLSQLNLERNSIKKLKKFEIKEIRNLYSKKGFEGKKLDEIVNKITSNKSLWLKTIMEEEIRLTDSFRNPVRSGIIVLLASLIGSLVPLAPFFFLPVKTGIIISFIVSTIALFVLGASKGKITYGNWKKSGFELAIIGIISAVLSYIIGDLVGKYLLVFYK